MKCSDIELKPGPFSELFSISNTETELSDHTLNDKFIVVHYSRVSNLRQERDFADIAFL